LIAAVTLLLVLPASAGAATRDAPTASTSGEEQVTYLTGGKLKPRKRLRYRVVCAASCALTVSSKLNLKGPNLGPITSTGTIAAGQVAEAVIRVNKGARSAIKANRRAAKLVTTVTATNTTTGEVDVDRRTYRFKR
jgi:hypothetical protein